MMWLFLNTSRTPFETRWHEHIAPNKTQLPWTVANYYETYAHGIPALLCMRWESRTLFVVETS